MTAYVGANLTKVQAGGSGDNIVGDGYIKTVEKVWIDSLAFTSVLTTADTVAIASIPANKKITGVEIFIPEGFAPTTTTINVGFAGDPGLLITSAAITIDVVNARVYRMNNMAGFSYVTTATATVLLKLGVTAMTAPTAGTIKTIVRYT